MYHFVRYHNVPGINPDSHSPSKKRVARNPALFFITAWKVATSPQARSWHGSQISAPICGKISHEELVRRCVRRDLLDHKVCGNISNADSNIDETISCIDDFLGDGEIHHHIVCKSIGNVTSVFGVRYWTFGRSTLSIPIQVQSEEHDHNQRN